MFWPTTHIKVKTMFLGRNHAFPSPIAHAVVSSLPTSEFSSRLSSMRCLIYAACALCGGCSMQDERV